MPMINFTFLNKTRISFSFCNENILHCHFQNLRCGTTSNLKLNGQTFSNHISVSVVLSLTFRCVLIPRTLKFQGKERKIRPPIEINPLCNERVSVYESNGCYCLWLSVVQTRSIVEYYDSPCRV